MVTTPASTPAIAELKGGEQRFSNSQAGTLSPLLQSALADKGIDPAALAYLSAPPYDPSFLPRMIGQLSMRLAYPALFFPQLADSIEQVLKGNVRATFTYLGTAQENAAIDAAIFRSPDRGGDRARIGRGSARFFSLGSVSLPRCDPAMRRVPIVILGAGAAAILAARTLVNMGFENILVLDQTGSYGGLWKQGNVRDGQTNNPFPFEYEYLFVDAAPLPGEHITTFLHNLATPPIGLGWQALPPVTKAKVLSVEPGDLAHRVTYRDDEGEHTLVAPIVVNALGIGKPRPPSRVGVMETDVPHLAGIRWQQVWSPAQAERLRGQTLVFNGFAGNSVAEMLVQIQDLNQRGYGIRYKCLTHYPQEALDFPRTTVCWRGRNYRLYRDNSADLTKLAGDLLRVERAVGRARDSRDAERAEVISEVEFWTVGAQQGAGRTMTVRRADGQVRTFAFDQLFTLIGYRHPPEELKAMGLVVTDDYLGLVAADSDGEFQSTPGAAGRSRLHAGYSGMGSVLKTPTNPNAQVIPGILYRLSDWLTTVIWRSAEYVARG
jgi:hypothetical protein